jgi:hypothetical protein
MLAHAHALAVLLCAEFCDLGTFTSYASKVLKDPSDNEQMMQLLVLLMDAARGIAALHSKSVVHGDGEHRPFPFSCRLHYPHIHCRCSTPWCSVVSMSRPLL